LSNITQEDFAMTRSTGLELLVNSIRQARKIDVASNLSERAQAFFRGGRSIEMIGQNDSSSSPWGRAIQGFASAAVACGLAAAITLSPAPTQAQSAPVDSAATTVQMAQSYVSLASMKFSDLVEIRDQIGLDEATLQEHGMALLDKAAVEKLTNADRVSLVGGLFWAAESLEGFDKAMRQSRAIIAERGEPARSHAEEVQAWQKWLDSRAQSRPSYGKSFIAPAGDPQNVAPDPIALKNTIERIQSVVQPQPITSVERSHSYPAERP
jgi:hypothetical protein